MQHLAPTASAQHLEVTFFFFFAFLSKMTRLLSDGACGVWGLKSGR